MDKGEQEMNCFKEDSELAGMAGLRAEYEKLLHEVEKDPYAIGISDPVPMIDCKDGKAYMSLKVVVWRNKGVKEAEMQEFILKTGQDSGYLMQ